MTGGAGFIGSHLSQYLLDSGHEVTVLDDLSSGKKEYVPKGAAFWNIACQDLPYTVFERKFDFCFHLASTVGVSKVLADPKKCISNILDSTRAVLNLDCPGINFSTSEVYGKNLAVLSEKSDCVLSGLTRWSYAAAKLSAEWCAIQSGWKSVRLFNVIGPRQNLGYGAVFPTFVSQALSDSPITVHGDGSQVRTFIDVRDCVEILTQLMDKKFEVVNIGGPYVMSVYELAKDIKVSLNSKSEIRFVEYPRNKGFEECQQRIPDLSLLSSLIGKFKYRVFSDTVEAMYEVRQTV